MFSKSSPLHSTKILSKCLHKSHKSSSHLPFKPQSSCNYSSLTRKSCSYNFPPHWTSPQQKRHYFVYPGPKSLDQIIDVRKFSQEDPEVQKYIWMKRYYESSTVVGETLSAQQYHVLSRRVAANRHFILPVDKGLGYVNMYIQHQDNYCLITNLREYKERGAGANPYVVMQHFPEYMEKGLVLVRAEVDTRWIDKPEAAALVKVMHKFYCEDQLFHDYVEQFNKHASTFNYNKFLDACKKTRMVVRDQERDYEQGLRERPKDPMADIQIDLNKLFKM